MNLKLSSPCFCSAVFPFFYLNACNAPLAENRGSRVFGLTVRYEQENRFENLTMNRSITNRIDNQASKCNYIYCELFQHVNT